MISHHRLIPYYSSHFSFSFWPFVFSSISTLSSLLQISKCFSRSLLISSHYRSSETVKLIDLLDAAKDRMRDSLQARADEGKCPLKVRPAIRVTNLLLLILFSLPFLIFLIKQNTKLTDNSYYFDYPVLPYPLNPTITLCFQRPVSI